MIYQGKEKIAVFIDKIANIGRFDLKHQYPTNKRDGDFNRTGEGEGKGRNLNIPFCGKEVIAQ